MAQAAQIRDVEVKQELAEVAVEVKQESMEVKHEWLDVHRESGMERLEVKRETLAVKQEPADFVHSTNTLSKSRSLGSIRVDAELGVLQAYKSNHVDIRTVTVSASAVGASFLPAEQVAQAQPTKTGGKPKGKSKAKNSDVTDQPSSSQIMEKRPARCVHYPRYTDGNARLTILYRARDKWVTRSTTRSPALPLFC